MKKLLIPKQFRLIGLIVFFLGNSFLEAGMLSAQATINITPGNNNVPITQMTYTIGGSTIVQSIEPAGIISNTDGPVLITEIQVNDGGTLIDLDIANEGLTITNNNFNIATTGVGVFENGTLVTTSDSSFPASLMEVVGNTDIMDYVYYDFVTNVPTGSDFDIIYDYPLLPDEDYLVVSERFGNSVFELVALDISGNPIAGANTLSIGPSWDWNTGYAASSYISDQTFFFTVVKVSKFFEGTGLSVPVYGYRIDNINESDVKFFGASDDVFINNRCATVNPTVLSYSTLPDCNNPGLTTILLTGISNGTHVGISSANAAAYDGPLYSMALPVSGSSYIFSNLTPNSTYIIRVYNDNDDCLSQTAVTTSAATPIPAAAAGTDQTTCADKPLLTLNGSISGSATSATWSGGAGTFSPDASTLNATYTPTSVELAAGSVNLTLTTDDPGSGCGAASDDLTLSYVPTPAPSAIGTAICEGSSVDLASLVTDADGGTLTYHTSLAAAQAGTAALSNTTVSPPSGLTTIYYVRSELTQSGVTCYGVASIPIEVSENPQVLLSDQTVCAGDNTYFTGVITSAAGGMLTFQWLENSSGSFQEMVGADMATLILSNVSTTSDGYSYRLVVSELLNSLTCSAEDEALLSVNPAATADAGPDQNVCSTEIIQLAATTSGPGSWSGGSGSFADPSNPITVYTPVASEYGIPITLTWTTADPDDMEACTEVSDEMRLFINEVDCGAFPWSGQ